MQLTVKRKWMGSRGRLICRVQLTEEETDIVVKYQLDTQDVGGYGLDFADLVLGVELDTEEGIENFIADEQLIIEACDKVAGLIDSCKSLTSESVITFPRR